MFLCVHICVCVGGGGCMCVGVCTCLLNLGGFIITCMPGELSEMIQVSAVPSLVMCKVS